MNVEIVTKPAFAVIGMEGSGPAGGASDTFYLYFTLKRKSELRRTGPDDC